MLKCYRWDSILKEEIFMQKVFFFGHSIHLRSKSFDFSNDIKTDITLIYMYSKKPQKN